MAWKNNPYNNPNAGSISSGAGIDVSRINAAGIICIRVQNYWRKCGQLFENGDFNGLRDAMNILWTEFYADATPNQKETVANLDIRIRQTIILRSRAKKAKFVLYNELYKKLIYGKWLFMKTLEKAQGIGRSYVDKFEDDWD